jgi:hypothetical protein
VIHWLLSSDEKYRYHESIMLFMFLNNLASVKISYLLVCYCSQFWDFVDTKAPSTRVADMADTFVFGRAEVGITKVP